MVHLLGCHLREAAATLLAAIPPARSAIHMPEVYLTVSVGDINSVWEEYLFKSAILFLWRCTVDKMILIS